MFLNRDEGEPYYCLAQHLFSFIDETDEACDKFVYDGEYDEKDQLNYRAIKDERENWYEEEGWD